MSGHDAIFLAILGVLTAVVASPIFQTVLSRRDRVSRQEMTALLVAELHEIKSLLRDLGRRR